MVKPAFDAKYGKVACSAAKRHGILIVISSDAHSTGGLDVLRYGVLQARRGGLSAAPDEFLDLS